MTRSRPCIRRRRVVAAASGHGGHQPDTRHPAVLAAAFATLQHVTRGRAHLGIGRGDTALTLIGEPLPRPRTSRVLLAQLQAFLRGETVVLNDFPSHIAWLPEPDAAKVPVAVFASGTRVIDVAARVGDRLTLAVGAEPERVQWGISAARDAASARAWTPPPTPSALSSSWPWDRSRRPARASARQRQRLGALPARLAAAAAAGDQAIVAAVLRDYDKYHHGTGRAPQARDLPLEFLDRFTVIGPPEYCVERLRALLALGLDHLVVVGASRDADPATRHRLNRLFAAEVLPALRAP